MFVAWAEKRGFLTAKAARPDTYRADNNLLRLAVEGRLCLCLRPEGYTKSKGIFSYKISSVKHHNFFEKKSTQSLFYF